MKRFLLLSVLAGVLVVAMAVPAMAAPAVWNFNGDYSATASADFQSDYVWVSSLSTQATNYTSYPSMWNEGTYTVGLDPLDYHNSWTSGPTKVAPDYFLIANGGATANMDIWEATVDVIAGHSYTLSAQFASIYPVAPASLFFKMNDVVFGTTGNVATSSWNTLSASLIIPDGVTSVTFSIGNGETAANGNDFAIDDITLTDDNAGKVTGGIKFMAGTTEAQLDFVAMSTATGAKGNVLYKNSLGLSFRGKVTSYWQNADGTVATFAGTITKKGDYTGYFWIAVADNGEGINAEYPDYGVRVKVGAGPYTAYDPVLLAGGANRDAFTGNVQIH